MKKILFFFLPATVIFCMLIFGCGSTGKRLPTIEATKAQPPQTCDTSAGRPDTLAASDQEAEIDTAESDEDTAYEDPGELIENAKSLCAEGDYAAADSNLKKAVEAIEAIDAEGEGKRFPSSQYVDDIVSIYNEKMPAQYSVPDEIALTSFQRQMVRSLDSMKIMPSESLSIATMGCQKNLVYDVPMVWNNRVQRAMFFYINNRKNTIDRWFPHSSYYIPFMRKMFADSGLPQDLAYLPLIESGFNPLAYSYAYASGIWQFITSTGRLYGLRHNYWLDERRDPIKSTQAAISYLKKLYGDFGNWHLALAAYNCGENGVSRSIARCRNNDFWKLKHLPAQTRNYVPCFLAALTIAKNPKCFGVNVPPADTFSLDTVLVNDCITLDTIAQAVGIPSDSLKKMNPHILRWCTPPDITNTVLYLPAGTKKVFDTLCTRLPEEKKVKWYRYQIRPGDDIQRIARHFNISVDVITTINRLKKPSQTGQAIVASLVTGHYLFLPLPDSPSPVTEVAYLPPITAYDEDDYEDATFYYVRKGDSISKIARRFHVTWNQIYRWNRLSASSRLRPGRRLIVRPALAPEPEIIALPNDTMKRSAAYVVRLGDTPFSIARRAGVTINDLLAWNNINATQPIIHFGDTLKLAAPEKFAMKKDRLPEQQPVVAAPPGTDSDLWQDTGWTDDWSTALPEEHKPVPALDSAKQTRRRVYTILQGDNLFRISRKFSVSLDSLLALNHLHENDVVHVGDSITLPPVPDSGTAPEMKSPSSNIVYYKVKDGDTLYRIATAFGISIEQLFNDNNLKPDSVIAPGEVIKVIKAGER
jgi:membrane-bound lytic murein transglycosylase D